MNTLNRQVPYSDSYIFTLCEHCHVPKSPNMHASVKGLLCRFKVSSLVVCVLSLLSLIGAYDIKLCKFIRNSPSFNNFDFTTTSSPFNLLIGLHKFSVTNPRLKYQTAYYVRFRCYYLNPTSVREVFGHNWSKF